MPRALLPIDVHRNVLAAKVPADDARALHQRAHDEGRTVSAIIREAVGLYLHGVDAIRPSQERTHA